VSKGGLSFVCAACGRPRVPLEQPVPRSGADRPALAEAERAQKDALFANVLGIVGSVLAGVVLLSTLGSWLLGFGFVALFLFVFALVFGGATGFAFATSARAKRRVEEAMHDAFGAVALDVLRARGPTTARTLGAVLGVPEPVAEAALARLPARTDVRVDTSIEGAAADGLVRYRIADAPSAPIEDDAHGSFEARLRAAMRERGQG
jgi:hypothetical protein